MTTVVATARVAETPPESLGGVLAKMKGRGRTTRAPTYNERIATLDKLERVISARKDAIADAISRDYGGRSKHESMIGEMFIVMNTIKHTKAHLRHWMKPEKRRVGVAFFPASVELRPQPVGVVGIISPWNYPVQLALVPLVQVLAAGNSAMIKPSELVPETAELLRDLIEDTFPEDQATVVIGGPEVGEAFSRLPFDHLVFTGSTRVGKAVMKRASENLVPVTLELGGKSPTIVGEGFDYRTAAERIMAGKLFNAGQTCIAPDYVMIPAAAREAFVSACSASVAKMYPTLLRNPDYTSVVNNGHFARLTSYLDDARSRGARVVEINPAGETLDATSRKLAPTLVLDPKDDMLLMQEEIFGPILPIATYQSLDEAIAYVNDHPRPLALYFFSHDKAATERVLNETTSGGVSVNETILHVAQDDLPFGGIGPSGMGAYHAREGFDSFSLKKPVFRQAHLNATGLLRPPYGKLVDRMLKLLVG